MVYGPLATLFDYVPLDDTPTKEQNKPNRKPVNKSLLGQVKQKVGRRPRDLFPPETKRQKSDMYLVADSPSGEHDRMDSFLASGDSPNTNYDIAQYFAPPPVDAQYFKYDQPLPQQSHYIQTIPMQIQEPPSERHRTTIMAMFMNDDDSAIPEIFLGNKPLPSDFNLDLVLDDQGHSALHWAAALGRISLLRLLIQGGANTRLLNINGECALMRAVIVPNNYDRMSFPPLLAILKGQILMTDHKGRNVLHHICLGGRMRSNFQSCRYYMECLIEAAGHIIAPEAISPHLVDDHSPSATSLVNQPDVCGDTAINIAARIGNHILLDQLLDLGADPSIPNKAGLCPADFGYEIKYSHDDHHV